MSVKKLSSCSHDVLVIPVQPLESCSPDELEKCQGLGGDLIIGSHWEPAKISPLGEFRLLRRCKGPLCLRVDYNDNLDMVLGCYCEKCGFKTEGPVPVSVGMPGRNFRLAKWPMRVCRFDKFSFGLMRWLILTASQCLDVFGEEGLVELPDPRCPGKRLYGWDIGISTYSTSFSPAHPNAPVYLVALSTLRTCGVACQAIPYYIRQKKAIDQQRSNEVTQLMGYR